jgi:hypothetical protein
LGRILVEEALLHALDELGEEGVSDANEVDDVALPRVELVDVGDVVSFSFVLLGKGVSELLELLLKEFEEVLFSSARFEAVGEDVRPAKDSAVSRELVRCSDQKLHVSRAHAQMLYQVFAALLGLATLVIGHFGGLLVRIIAMIVKLVIFELCLDGLTLLILLSCIGGIVLVAVVITASGRSVFFPIASAQPAELEATPS